MILLFHKDNKVIEIISLKDNCKIEVPDFTLTDTLFFLAKVYTNDFILWCHYDLRTNVNYNYLSTIFHHKLIFATFNSYENNLLSTDIGYVSESVFANINSKVKYPTWMMSSSIGGLHAEVFNAVCNAVTKDLNLDYFLTSFAKLAMPLGLLCVSEPKLVVSTEIKLKNKKPSNFVLAKFIKQHLKSRWLFFLFSGVLLQKKKVLISQISIAFFYKKRKLDPSVFKNIKVSSTRTIIEKREVDVIIPTIGRKNYLLDVLNDFEKQTVLPKRIIIIEQNPDKNSISELDYLYNNTWSFEIIHKFIHQTGACNARNIALDLTRSEWIFLADDDIRIEKSFIEESFFIINNYQNNVYSFNCYIKNEVKEINSVTQWGNFGSGCSIVKNDCLKKIKFNLNFEFGYGEDSDFGMQLRNQGNDILYVPEPSILHLKAPIGGFRTIFKPTWHLDKIQPKPSPTVMLFRLLNHSKEQIFGYKLVLFFKYYFDQDIKNPYLYFKVFLKQWDKSLIIANNLKNS